MMAFIPHSLMVRPADLCHQWCHKFIVLLSLVKLFHAVETSTIEAFNAWILKVNCELFILNTDQQLLR